MTVYRFSAQPLTPIHVGDGDTLAPEDYLIDGDWLVRYNRSAVLRDMPAERRRQLEGFLDKNEFVRAQNLLRESVQVTHRLSRIEIGAESRDDLQKVVSNPLDPVVRAREVHGFVRNPLNSRPYLPGSAIKGAIRTALVNHFTQQHKAPVKQALGTLMDDRQTRKKAWQTLETEVLNFQFPKLHEDPFRFLKVADAELPPDSTRVDKVVPVKRDGGDDTKGIQMHFERLLSRGDGADKSFTVELELDELALKDSRVRKGRVLDLATIRNACNLFYWGRMNAELERFFARQAVDRDKAEQNKHVHNAVKRGLTVRDKDKQLTLYPPSHSEHWQDRILLRVGRFSHFESMSVNDLRQGWNAQKKEPFPPGQQGSSRTLCRCRQGTAGASILLPFGWLLLKLQSES